MIWIIAQKSLFGSPFVYGVSFLHPLELPEGLTFDIAGSLRDPSDG
jgi:hypothetical protein